MRVVRYVLPARSTRGLNARRYNTSTCKQLQANQHLPIQLHSPFLQPSEYIIHHNETSIEGGVGGRAFNLPAAEMWIPSSV